MLYWYRAQYFCIKWGSSISESFSVNNGVRQGGILSPHLFAIYVDELSTDLNDLGVGCHVDNISINHILYADDLCLLAPCPSALQYLIDVCVEYGTKNDIVYNPSKSECMIVKPAGYTLKCPQVLLNGNSLDYVNRVKYLGVIIQDTLKDHDDMTRQLRFLYSRCNTIARKFSKCSYPVLSTLYKSYCAPSYCSFLWCNYTDTMYNKLKIAHNNVFRKLFGYKRRDSATAMFINNNMDNLDVMIRKNTYGFIKRLNASTNCIIQCFIYNSTVKSGPLWKRWYKCLYSCNFI